MFQGYLSNQPGEDGEHPFRHFFSRVGQGIQKAADAGWGAEQVVGEEPDELFPYSYKHYESDPHHEPIHPVKPIFNRDPLIHNVVLEDTQSDQVLNKLSLGQPLHADQLKHVKDMAEFVHIGAQGDTEKAAAHHTQHRLYQAMVGNQLLQAPQNDQGQVQYRGHWFSKEDAPGVVKADLHSLFTTHAKMKDSNVSGWPTWNEVVRAMRNEGFIDDYKEPPKADYLLAMAKTPTSPPPPASTPTASVYQQRQRHAFATAKDYTNQFEKHLKERRHEIIDNGASAKELLDIIEGHLPLTRSQYDFQHHPEQGWPGEGEVGVYQGKLVSGAYFGNASVGYLARALGMSRWAVTFFSQLDSVVTRGKWDQSYDQQSIISGMDRFDYKNPWYSGVPYLEQYGLQ